MTIRPNPTISIPLGLLEQVERGNVLLFIGEESMQDANGQVVIEQWASTLAARCRANHPEEYSFSEAAQAYEDEMGRHALVQFVRDELERLGDEPHRVHRLIAELTHCNVLVTTCFDCCLEQAFEEAGRPLDVIIGRVDVAFEDEEKSRLYKLRGSVERVESLVLTEEDYDRFFEAQVSMSVVLRAYLATKTILFIGYDLADPQFRNLYRRVTDLLDNYARRAYAFGTVPAQRVARWCKRHGIEVVETGVTDFLEALLTQLATRDRVSSSPTPRPGAPAADDTATHPLSERPYKLLDHYDPEDADIFFGREQEIQTLASLIYAHRLVLLYALSGAGKTSLLLAGVTPHLEHTVPLYATLYVRGRTDPAQAIRQAMCRRLPNANLPQTGALVDFLHAATIALGMPLVIFLDQFEEFFAQPAEPHSRLTFIAELGDLYDARVVPVKIVFSLREDWLAAMSEFEALLPDLYRIKLRLLPLTREQARQAITLPARQIGIEYAPDLVDRLLNDLVGATVDGLQEQVRVMPPQLQLVCHALYERVRSQRRSWIALADYTAVGGVQGILARHVTEALQEHPGEERAVAKVLLLALVSTRATRTWITLPELMARANAKREIVAKVLARLVRQRLVRRLEDDQGYELTHNVLAATIAEWIGDEDRQLKQIQEMLQDELTDWRQDHSVFPSQSKFQRINSVREHLRLTDEETAFLLRTALLYDEDVAYWLAQVEKPARQVEILLTMLKSEAVQSRRTAAAVLAEFPQDDVVGKLADVALSDPDSAIRETAAMSLGRVGSRACIDLMISMALAGGSEERRRAVRALALIQDVDPSRLPVIAGTLWRPIYYELAKIRFWRNWPRISRVTAVGAVGGAVGFGVALTPLVALLALSAFKSIQQTMLDILFFAILLALLGLIPGAGTAFGISVGDALLDRRTKLGRVIGGTLLGGGSFAVAFAPLVMADASTSLNLAYTNDPNASPTIAYITRFLASLIGSGLFGVMIGFGVTAPAQFDPRLSIRLMGGAVGAMLGMTLLMVFYRSEYLQSPASIVVLLVAGGLLGLIMAFAIGWAEARWPRVENEREQIFDREGSEDVCL